MEVDNEVVIHAAKKLPLGEFVNVKITKAYDYDLEGEVSTANAKCIRVKKAYLIRFFQLNRIRKIQLLKKLVTGI
jgi:hypothetical protein